MGEDAYITENMRNDEFETFNPILNIGGLFCVIIYACFLYFFYPVVKGVYKF